MESASASRADRKKMTARGPEKAGARVRDVALPGPVVFAAWGLAEGGKSKAAHTGAGAPVQRAKFCQQKPCDSEWSGVAWDPERIPPYYGAAA